MFTYLNAPVFDPSGYSEVSRNLFYELNNIGLDFSLIPYENWNLINVGVENRLGNLFLSKQVRRGTKIDYSKPWFNLKIPDDFDIIDGRINVGLCMYEVERIPKKWANICNSLDRLFVPSTFNYRTFTESGVDKDIIEVA